MHYSHLRITVSLTNQPILYSLFNTLLLADGWSLHSNSRAVCWQQKRWNHCHKMLWQQFNVHSIHQNEVQQSVQFQITAKITPKMCHFPLRSQIWGGAQPPPQTLPLMERGYPLPNPSVPSTPRSSRLWRPSSPSTTSQIRHCPKSPPSKNSWFHHCTCIKCYVLQPTFLQSNKVMLDPPGKTFQNCCRCCI